MTRIERTLLHAALGASALLWACSMQPSGGGGGGGAPTPTLSPEPGVASGTARVPTPRQRRAGLSPARRLAPLPPVPRATGPQASKPAPLPTDGTLVDIFHSGNVEGEFDPCG